MKIFPVYYFPPVSWFAAAEQEGDIILEVWEHYRKQQLYNRARINTANKVLKITIPIRKAKEHTPVCKREISYDWNWPREHWVSITSAYRSSPYFEFYEDQLEPLFTERRSSLLDLNLAIIDTLRDALGLTFTYKLSERYHGESHYERDYRRSFHHNGEVLPEWFEAVPYQQVFGEDFVPDLSILDLLCCMGPAGVQVLKEGWKAESEGRANGVQLN